MWSQLEDKKKKKGVNIGGRESKTTTKEMCDNNDNADCCSTDPGQDELLVVSNFLSSDGDFVLRTDGTYRFKWILYVITSSPETELEIC